MIQGLYCILPSLAIQRGQNAILPLLSSNIVKERRYDRNYRNVAMFISLSQRTFTSLLEREMKGKCMLTRRQDRKTFSQTLLYHMSSWNNSHCHVLDVSGNTDLRHFCIGFSNVHGFYVGWQAPEPEGKNTKVLVLFSGKKGSLTLTETGRMNSVTSR